MLFGSSRQIEFCHKPPNRAIGRVLCHSEATSETAQVVMILSLKVDFADPGECEGRGYQVGVEYDATWQAGQAT